MIENTSRKLEPGHATAEGTARFAARFADRAGAGFFTSSATGLTLSSVGAGMYKGEISAEGDRQWAASLDLVIENGVNVADTAIRYRSMRSEKALGQTLRRHFDAGTLSRDEIFISTKGGLIAVPQGVSPQEHAAAEIIGKRGIPEACITDHKHCMEPDFLKGELAQSRENLGLETIDCYFIHNPELAFLTYGKAGMYAKLREVFTLLELAADAGHIRAYGLASWCGFRRNPGSLFHIDLEQVLRIARDVGGSGHRCRYLELPLSIGMPHVRVAGNGFWDRLQESGLDVFTSASMYEGHLDALFNLQRIMRMAGREDSPEEAAPARVSFPASENSLAQLFATLLAARDADMDMRAELLALANGRLDVFPAALHLVRSTPGVTCALAGLRLEKYARAMLPLIKEDTLPAVDAFWQRLGR